MSTKDEGLSRRELLRILGAGAAAAALPACGDSSGETHEVLVIGAGVAGLTIANALSSAGVDVVVLEARDRVGGRIWTVDMDGPLDMGAAWMEGIEGNPLTCLAAQNGLTWTEAEWIKGNSFVFDATRGVLLESIDLFAAGVAAISDFPEAAERIRTELGPGASFADAVQRFLDTSDLSADNRRLAEYLLVQVGVELGSAGPAGELSFDSTIDDGTGFGGGNHRLDGTYKAIVDLLKEGLDIRSGQAVTTIADDGQGIVVETQTGEFRGARAVVTVPLGVLKSDAITFVPELSTPKQDAIRRLKMGTLERVAMRFDRPYWIEAGRESFAYMSQTTGEFPGFFDGHRYGGRPVLECFYSARFSREVTPQMSDEEIVDRILAIQREIFPPSSVPDPVQVMVSRWATDPLSGGSYSFIPVGASVDDIVALGEPASERLFFAGEATEPNRFALVDGAMISGLREARRLLDREDIELLGRPAPVVGCGV